MQNEGSAKVLEAAFQKHWEKLAIGVVLVAAVVYLGFKFPAVPPAEVAAVDAMMLAVKRVDDERNPNLPAPSSFKKSADSAQIAAYRPPSSTHSNPTNLVREYIITPQTLVLFLIPVVKLESATPSFEGIELVWSLTDVKADPPVRGQHLVELKTLFVQIERRVKDGPWKVFAARVPLNEGKELKYLDTQVEPKTDYEYRLTLGATDKTWLVENPTGLVPRPSAALVVRSLHRFQISFDNIQKPPEDAGPTKGTAWVTIVKHDPRFGEVSFSCNHGVGDRIGWTLEDGKPTSIHRVFSKRARKSVPVDFNTGAVLGKISTDKIVGYTYKQCQRIATDEGMECKGPQPRQDSYKANEVVYVDEDKQTVVVRKPIGIGPRSDQLCEDHGGAPKGANR